MPEKSVKKYDYVILGSGMGGLSCAVILAMEGKSVCVIEKNAQIGGALQTFRRDGVKFETGVHYVGSLEKGQPLFPYFKYMGIIDDLTLDKLGEDAYDTISIGREGILYPHAQGFDNFKTQLLKYFPGEEKALDKYINKVNQTCKDYSLYNLHEETNVEDEIDLSRQSAKEVIDSCTENEKLRAVLSGVNLLYAGRGHKSPFYVHALIVNHYMQSAYRFPEGSDQISKALGKKLKNLGGQILRNSEVLSLPVKDGLISSVVLKNGVEVHGKEYISNIHPQQTIDLLNAEGLRKSYVNRIRNIENTTSCFILYIVLKDKALPYRNYNTYHFKSTDVWNCTSYDSSDWGKDFAVFYSKYVKNEAYCKSMTVITYMNYEEVHKWKDTTNTRHEENYRGKEYEDFKELKSQTLLNNLAVLIPEIRSLVKSYYSSTPLTQRDYLNISKGSIYGIERDFNSPLNTFISTQVKIKNLYLTGQNLIMHGVLGVTIGAIVTCSAILGKSYLIEKIKAANSPD